MDTFYISSYESAPLGMAAKYFLGFQQSELIAISKSTPYFQDTLAPFGYK